MRPPTLTLLIALTLISCKGPEAQHPPEQTNAAAVMKSEIKPQDLHRRYVEMIDPDISEHILSDISAPAPNATWLWTFDKPTLRVWTGSGNTARHLLVKMAMVEATMKDTGPVTVRFFVNGEEVGKKQLPKPGSYQFETDVNAGLLKPDDWATLSMTTSPIWTAPKDKKHLGFLLIGAGFRD